jgi:quercetin dioxygenase-like cupin family protein
MNSSTHMTSGTDRRPARSLSGEGLIFRLGDEIDALRRDLGRASGQRTAKTLTKTGSLRVTLVVLQANATLEPDATAGHATIQVLDGRLRVQTDGQVHDLGAGELIVLDRNLREPIQAAEASAFLVTVDWPEGAGAWPQEAADGHL